MAHNKVIRLAMVGMVDGNGHPCSWSAMFNGFDPDKWQSAHFQPFPFSETIELMKMLIAGIRSREEGGREVLLAGISED
jgi:hypothetical protein